MKNKFTIFAGFLIILAILVVLFMRFGHKKTGSLPTPEPEISSAEKTYEILANGETNNWQSYINPEFSIKYPNDWKTTDLMRWGSWKDKFVFVPASKEKELQFDGKEHDFFNYWDSTVIVWFETDTQKKDLKQILFDEVGKPEYFELRPIKTPFSSGYWLTDSETTNDQKYGGGRQDIYVLVPSKEINPSGLLFMEINSSKATGNIDLTTSLEKMASTVDFRVFQGQK